MKSLVIAISFAIVSLLTGLVAPLIVPNIIPKSPVQVYPAYEGPGTGHGFGYGIKYTIERHTHYKGTPMVVIKSGAFGESDVEIWSPIPELVVLPDASTFTLTDTGESFFYSLRVTMGAPR